MPAGPRALLPLVATCLLAAPLPLARAADLPSVARVHYQLDNSSRTLGTVFFLAVNNAAGAAAVGAAHSYDLDELARAGEIQFRLGQSKRRVARSSRFLVRPGRSFREPGASLRDDYVVFALDDRPYGIQVLQPDLRPMPQTGERVRLLGVPTRVGQDEDDLFGTVARVTPDRIEVDLDVRADLRGWGGAPLLLEREDRVIGLLEAAWPAGSLLRVGVAPIAAVVLGLRTPLEGGGGAPFARFAVEEAAGATPPAPAAERVASVRADAPRSLLGKSRSGAQEIRLVIEQPAEGSILGDPNGAFVAGRALASLGEVRTFDLLFVVDTSASTAEPSGADVNGNGIVGQRRFAGLGAIFGAASSDPGDSILAAEVAAAQRLLRSLDPRNTRVGLVTFAGESVGGGVRLGRVRAPAITEEPLTTEYGRIRRALQRIIERGPDGNTHMAAGVDQATIELLGLRGALSEPRPGADRIVLFFTDGQPTLPYDPYFMADNVRAVLRAADRSRKAGVRIHSFAIGPEALAGPIATVEMAARTNGYFTPVRNPADLINVIEEVSFADVESVRVRNVTTGEEARHVASNPDGTFGALVPLRAGVNRIEIAARSSDGREAREAVSVSYAPGTPNPPLPSPLVALRNELLERRLLELRQGRLEAERETAERTRKELLVEIEREREAARERAERQRKELNLEVDPGPPSS